MFYFIAWHNFPEQCNFLQIHTILLFLRLKLIWSHNAYKLYKNWHLLGFFLLFSSSKWLWQVMHNSNTSNETSKITNLWNITSYFKELIILCKENCQSASKADYTNLNIFNWKNTWLCTLCSMPHGINYYWFVKSVPVTTKHFSSFYDCFFSASYEWIMKVLTIRLIFVFL